MGLYCGESPIDLNTFSAEDAKIRSKSIVTEYSKNQLYYFL